MKIKEFNLAQCTGKIQYIRFYENTKSLMIVLSLFRPRWSRNGENPIVADYPNIYVEGEMAEKYKDQFKEGDFITAIGHIDERMVMIHMGRGMYRHVRGPALIPDQILPDYGYENINLAAVTGTVDKVYHNAEKKYHTITAVCKVEGKDTHVQFTHFDLDMSFTPEVGDTIVMNGIFRTRTTQNEQTEGPRYIKQTSIVAKSISLIKK